MLSELENDSVICSELDASDEESDDDDGCRCTRARPGNTSAAFARVLNRSSSRFVSTTKSRFLPRRRPEPAMTSPACSTVLTLAASDEVDKDEFERREEALLRDALAIALPVLFAAISTPAFIFTEPTGLTAGTPISIGMNAGETGSCGAAVARVE